MPNQTTATTPRVAMYLRISRDFGEQQATGRQREDCDAWIARNGAELVDVYEDVDTSAFSRKVVRPQFERLLQDVKAGRFDGVVAWKIDRIARRSIDFATLDEACQKAGAFIATVSEGIDTRSSRLTAEVLVSVAREEAENISRRLRRKNAADFAQGRPHAGGRRPFGYTGGTTREIIEDEAELVREAAQRAISGESCNVIARDWNARGLTTISGNAWASDSISSLLRSPTIVGKRAYHGEVHHERGWEPIITDEEFATLGDILSVRSSRMHGPRTKHLLTGIARCGRCQHPLWGSASGRGVYRCPKGLGNGCGRLVRHMQPLEDAVRDLWVGAVASERVQAAIAAEVEARQGVEFGTLSRMVRDDEEALTRLAVAHYSERRITEAEFYAARDAIEARLKPNRERLESQSPTGDATKMVGADPESLIGLWEQCSVDRRRQLLLTVLEQVDVLPAGSGNRLTLEQLRPVWRY